MRAVDVNASEWDCTLEGREGTGEGTKEKARRHEGGGREEGSTCLAAPLAGGGPQRGKVTEGQRDEEGNSELRIPNSESARRVRFSGRFPSVLSPQSSVLDSALSTQHSSLSSVLDTSPALRLGFRQLKGFRQEHANVIVAARARCGLFTSIEQLHRQSGLPVSALRVLAEADAFGSMQLSRRQVLCRSCASKMILTHSSTLCLLPTKFPI